MFLAYAYPLSERSGVNFKGAINISNLTEFDKEEEFALAEDEDEDEDQVAEDENNNTMVDYNLYQKFWGLQKFASNPGLARETMDLWREFLENAQAVLTAFEGHSLSPIIIHPSSPFLDDSGEMQVWTVTHFSP